MHLNKTQQVIKTPRCSQLLCPKVLNNMPATEAEAMVPIGEIAMALVRNEHLNSDQYAQHCPLKV
jgi:hypothetical protein